VAGSLEAGAAGPLLCVRRRRYVHDQSHGSQVAGDARWAAGRGRYGRSPSLREAGSGYHRYPAYPRTACMYRAEKPAERPCTQFCRCRPMTRARRGSFLLRVCLVLGRSFWFGFDFHHGCWCWGVGWVHAAVPGFLAAPTSHSGALFLHFFRVFPHHGLICDLELRGSEKY
jgi:hypothetical protein